MSAYYLVNPQFAHPLRLFLKKIPLYRHEELTKVFHTNDECCSFVGALGEKNFALYNSSDLTVSRKHVFSYLYLISDSDRVLFWQLLRAFVECGISDRFLAMCDSEIKEKYGVEKLLLLLKEFVLLCDFISKHDFIKSKENRVLVLQKSGIIFKDAEGNDFVRLLIMQSDVLSPVRIFADVWDACLEIKAAVLQFANSNWGTNYDVPSFDKTVPNIHVPGQKSVKNSVQKKIFSEPTPPAESFKCWRITSTNSIFQQNLAEFFNQNPTFYSFLEKLPEKSCVNVAWRLGETNFDSYQGISFYHCRQELINYIRSKANTLTLSNLLVALAFNKEEHVFLQMLQNLPNAVGIYLLFIDYCTMVDDFLKGQYKFLRSNDCKKILQQCFVDNADQVAENGTEFALRTLQISGSLCPTQIRFDVWTGEALQLVKIYCDKHNLFIV